MTITLGPKTIDNDLVETDHCPGYGSAARFLANAARDATYDTIASPQLNPVRFIEVMGRDAGWLAAAACAPIHRTGGRSVAARPLFGATARIGRVFARGD